jgi:hypothetical protein
MKILATIIAIALALASHRAGATADGCDPGWFLNLRAAPMMGSKVVARLKPGDRLSISSATCETRGSLSICNEDGWTRVDGAQWPAAPPHIGAGLHVVQGEADREGACKSMNRAQEQKHLAQANRHIAELTVQIVRQRVIVKYALETGQRSEMAESLLDALEGSLRIFEKHRVLILGQLLRQPSE